MKVNLTDVRLAFPAVFEPKSVAGSDALKYSAVFIIEPNSENAKKLAQAVSSVAKEKWLDKADGIVKELVSKDRVCYKKTEKANSSGDVYAGFEGTHHVNASNSGRPTVLDRNRQPLTAADGKPYGGCYVNAVIDVWPQDNKYGKRVNATLLGLQFVRDGDAFSGSAPASADDFEVLDGAASDDLM